jgi:hypothetical protein
MFGANRLFEQSVCTKPGKWTVVLKVSIMPLFTIFIFGFGIIVTMWNYCDNVVLLWQCGIIVTMWNYCDNVELLWQCGIIVTMWYYCDNVELLWQCGIIVTMWYYCDNVELLWQCGIIVTMWYYCDNVVFFFILFYSFIRTLFKVLLIIGLYRNLFYLGFSLNSFHCILNKIKHKYIGMILYGCTL